MLESVADGFTAPLVPVNVQGMKAERESMTLAMDDLRDEIQQLNATIARQQEEIQSQRAEIERLNQVQTRHNDAYAICLIDGDGYIFDKVREL
jgi:septal ring factor EnvC (AmiA/AmiB activator)